ncbi:hypothetical protein [Citrobacter braakii]|uniref:hypothetical protein n=1 Tax=Citrobacter braakii TaxID=57706 RepID=UPI000CEE11AF|nr:hypothetical protein [Citrobacter braakii]PPS52145.1 hypothetical protein BWR12_05265 [Citrobacter braakii]
MTTNHPAHGPVSLERLHQIREILSKAAAQSDGGNLGYAMADAVKVIDGAIAAFGAEPQRNPVLAYADSYRDMAERGVESIPVWSVITDLERNIAPLYTAPPAPVVPTFDEWLEIRGNKPLGWVKDAMRESYDACRASMLQTGNSPVTPVCWCSTCRPVTMNDMRFVVCPECGNKRCPRASDHNNACTGSNDPGQVSSAYPAAPQQENI